MYTKDKATRITLRLNDDQFNFVKRSADVLGVSPSEFLRMVINSTMSMSTDLVVRASTSAKATSAVTEWVENLTNEEGLGRENDKTDFNDIV